MGNYQRWFINANWPDESTQNSSRYVQFSLGPASDNNLNVTSVSFYLNAGGTSAMQANIYISTDQSFSSPILLNTSGVISVTRDSATEYNYSVDTKINAGESFYLRIYPWLPGGSTNTGKYIFLQDMIISGITIPSGTVLPLSVSTTVVTDITSSSAVCGGNVIADGGKTVSARGVCWNTSGQPALSDNKTVDGSGTGVYQSTLSNLNPESTYYVRAYATNSDSTVYGEELSFKTAATQMLAFPGAEGFGRFTTGGRGGRVLEVTNLNDDNNPGSLRWAISQNYPRIIVFKVSGTIKLANYLKINYGNVTIAGQTAPGDGICLSNYTLSIEANNVIIRYIRSRLGDVTKLADDAAHCNGGQKNIIIDHCSFSWAIDEDASFYDNQNFTLQWCIISESLYHSYHPKGDHGYGGIWGGMGATFHHNLLADNSSRNPRFCGARYHLTTASTEIVDFRNNVIFNWGFNSAYGGESGNQNMINNYFKPGPATSSSKLSRIVNPSDSLNPFYGYSKWYVNGNYVDGNPQVTGDNWNGGVNPDHAPLDSIKLNNPIPVAPVTTQTAQAAYDSVLANAGCSFPVRDSADLRVINEVKTGDAPFGATYAGGNKGIIDSQNDVGGWPTLVSLPAPLDTDHDGMPDSWETSHGLNPSDSSDARQVGPDGYTMIEEYINGLISSNPTSVKTAAQLPGSFVVNQNYPNPFNPSTQIVYSIPKAGSVTVKIFNITGQLVRVLYDGYSREGNHNLSWDGSGTNGSLMASGIYFCAVRFDNSMKVIKMQLLK